MSSSLLNIGAFGLRVANISLQAADSNTANASTPGYLRQEAVQTGNTPSYVGVGYLGQGANITTVKYIYDRFLMAQMRSGQASTGTAGQLDSPVSGPGGYMSDNNNGLISSLASFFNAADGLASKPSDTITRQVFLNAATGLQSRFNLTAGQLSSPSSQVNTQVQTQTSTINGTAQQIAALNDQTSKAGASTGQPANDLRGRRDQLVQTFNQSTKVSVVQTDDGRLNIYAGNDQALARGNQSYRLTAVSSQYDPIQLSVGYKSPGDTVNIDDDQLGGGVLDGLMGSRNSTLIPAQSSPGRLAMVVSADVDMQNKLGMNANGKMGTGLFSMANPSVAPSTNNTGSGLLIAGVTNANAGQDYNYQVKYQGGVHTVLHHPGGSTSIMVPNRPTTINGVTLNLSGTMSGGDSFLVRPTANVVATTQMLTTDYHNVAATSPVVLGQSSDDTDSTTVSLLGMDSMYAGSSLISPISLTYSSAVGGSLSGFPGSVAVAMGDTSIAYVGGAASCTQGTTYAFNGVQTTLSGSPGNGGTFVVLANTANSIDNRNANALTKLRDSNLLDDDMTSIGSVWNDLITQVGVQVNHANTSLTSQRALLTNSTQQQQSVSSVSLDEEVMNLMKYQQARQALARTIQTTNSLFGSLLPVAGG